MAKTSSGLEENVAGLLSYVLGWLTGLVFILIEKENKFVRFHAMQSIIVFGSITVVAFVIGWIPVIGAIVAWILWILGLVLWIVLMVKAYQGAMYKVPVAGNLAEKWVG